MRKDGEGGVMGEERITELVGKLRGMGISTVSEEDGGKW